MPKISVVVPVYNTEKYLKKCLDSLVAQTLSDIEIICVDDASTDGSLAILEQYASKDSRIKVIKLIKNQGTSFARNNGIKVACGEYLSFVDSDDYLARDFLEQLYSFSDQADIVKGLIQEDKNGALTYPTWQISGEEFLKDPVKFVYGFTSAIYKTDFIKENNISFPENIKNLEDPYFLIVAISKAQKLAQTDKAIYYYHKRDKSASCDARIDDIIEGADKIFQLINTVDMGSEAYIYLFEKMYLSVSLLLRRADCSSDQNLFIQQFLKQQIQNSVYKNDVMKWAISKIRSIKKGQEN